MQLEDFESGTLGDPITIANTTFDEVSNTPVFDDTHVHTGDLAAYGSGEMMYPTDGVTVAEADGVFWFYLDYETGGNIRILGLRLHSVPDVSIGTEWIRLQVNDTEGIYLDITSFPDQVLVPAASMAAWMGHWVRVTWAFDNGVIDVELFGDPGTITDSADLSSEVPYFFFAGYNVQNYAADDGGSVWIDDIGYPEPATNPLIEVVGGNPWDSNMETWTDQTRLRGDPDDEFGWTRGEWIGDDVPLNAVDLHLHFKYKARHVGGDESAGRVKVTLCAMRDGEDIYLATFTPLNHYTNLLADNLLHEHTWSLAAALPSGTTMPSLLPTIRGGRISVIADRQGGDDTTPGNEYGLTIYAAWIEVIT